MSSVKRCFIAVVPSQALRLRLAEVARRLRDSQAMVREVPVANLHLTLRFLGDVPVDDLPELSAHLRAVCGSRKSLRASVGGLVALPSERRARVICADVSCSGLEDLRLAIEWPGPDRRSPTATFRPHMTLARFRRPCDARRVMAALVPFAGLDFGEMSIDEVVLFESRLGQAGPHYEIVTRHRLGAKRS